MSHPTVPRFALITVDEKGNSNAKMYSTPDLMDVEKSKLPITTAYYCAKVTSARVFSEISFSAAGRKAGTTVPKKKA